MHEICFYPTQSVSDVDHCAGTANSPLLLDFAASLRLEHGIIDKRLSVEVVQRARLGTSMRPLLPRAASRCQFKPQNGCMLQPREKLLILCCCNYCTVLSGRIPSFLFPHNLRSGHLKRVSPSHSISVNSLDL